MGFRNRICARCVVVIMLLLSRQGRAGAEVIDFTHLLDEKDAAPAAEVGDADAMAGRQAVDSSVGLARRVVELEQVVRHREHQIHDLKQALEEVTREFEGRVEQVRSQGVPVVSDELPQLREALSEKAAALERMRADYAALEREKGTALEEQAHSLRAAHAAALRDKAAAYQQALSKVLADHDLEVSALLKTLESETATVMATFEADQAALRNEFQHEITALQEQRVAEKGAQQAQHAETVASLRSQYDAEITALHTNHTDTVASLRSAHEKEMSLLRRTHASALTSLQASFDMFRAETAPEREELAKLRSEVLRLDAALQVARTENDRERFLLAYNSGSLFLAARRHDRAEESFLKALAIQEDDAALHYNLGILYDEHLRQPAKARHHYERFLALAPNDRDAPLVMQWLREVR